MKYSNTYIDGVYLHNKKLIYPKIDDQHMVIYPKYHNYVYDENFPYRFKGFGHSLITFFLHVFLVVVGYPLVRIVYGLKIKGRKYFKEYKKETGSKAMISVANHTVALDFLMICRAGLRFPIIPMWQEGAESKIGMLIRHAIGLVVPTLTFQGIQYSIKEMHKVLEEKKWLHVYPESASWPLYPCLRAFKPGTFTLAFEHNLPVLPIGIKFREPKGIFKLYKKNACATITIDKPIHFNKALEKNSAIEDLRKRCFNKVLNLIGIKSEEQNTKVRDEIYRIQDEISH